MAQNVKVCKLDPDLEEKCKKFRFRKEKTNAAIVMKIDKETLTIVLDEEYDDCSIDDIKEELSEHQPRYFIYSYCYKHDDGRVSYPLCFIFVSPSGCKPEQQMMYAGSKLALVNDLQISKVFEVRDRDDLSEDWLIEKLKFFK